MAQLVKNPPARQETWVRSLGWEDVLEKGKATHSSIPASRIPWTIYSPWGRKESDTSERLSLFSALKDRTNNLFKQVYEQKSLKGRANDAIASACLYIACRQEGVPRTFKGKFLIV